MRTVSKSEHLGVLGLVWDTLESVYFLRTGSKSEHLQVLGLVWDTKNRYIV